MQDLQVHFFTKKDVIKAVDGISYDVHEGETVALVGESGCGKSVSALSLIRLIPPPGRILGGQVLFQGQDLLQLSSEELLSIRGHHIAMIFQNPLTSLNPALPIGEQVAEALMLHRLLDKETAYRETTRLLQRVSIPDPEKRLIDYPHQFSGGMSQKIMIAMAVSCSPKLLIADEPTSNVDATTQTQLLELIQELSHQLNTAVLLITHNLGVVARYAQRVNVMYAGRLVESAPVTELFANPRHPYTIGLLALMLWINKPGKAKLVPIDGMPPNLSRLPPGCAFGPRCHSVGDLCLHQPPPWRQVAEDHFIACWS